MLVSSIASVDEVMELEVSKAVGVTIIVDMMVVAGAMLITRGLSPPIRVEAAMDGRLAVVASVWVTRMRRNRRGCRILNESSQN